jgi:toxin ParE1/3/4
MPTKLVWSNQARDDLLQIYVQIGLEQPAAAERLF